MKQLSKILSYPLSAVFLLLFGLNLLLFHPIQWFCLNVFGYQAHKKSVDYFNWVIVRLLHIVGGTYAIRIHEKLPLNVPVIIVSNHQSMWDISPLIWFLRKLHPKFISKIELGKGIPSVSFNLKYGGSVLIDRKDPQQATEQISKIARYISEHNRSVVIFPEGTRSRDGHLKTFHRKGLTTLFKNAPDAYVLPITVNNSWKLQTKGMFPIPLGVHLTFDIQAPVKVSDHSSDALIDLLEQQIGAMIKN